MTSSRFGILNGELPKNYIFKNDIRKHEIDGTHLKAYITYEKPTLYNEIEIVKGNVLDYKNLPNRVLLT